MLVNHCYTQASRLGATEDRGLDAILQDAPAVRLMDPAKDLDERTLPCPILTGERMHLSGIKAEIDVAQNLDGPEALCDPPKLNDRRRRIPPGIGIVRIASPGDVPGFS